MNSKKGISALKPREKLFCINYVSTGDTAESALKAGFKKNSFKVGSNLLLREDINNEVERLYEQKKKNLLYKACSGYERLAFGSTKDPIILAFSSELDLEKICNMDLFNVSEIKRSKDGAIEIKFFDRIRALEKIQNMDFVSTEQSTSFYEAIKKGTNTLTKD